MDKLQKTQCLIVGLALILISWEAAYPETDVDSKGENAAVSMAVEFMDHAAAAYISQDKGWFSAAGINVNDYESYTTGMALASALARGDIQVAYICLAPAINAYVNAGVPIKIVAGTHKYGYGLVADGKKITTVRDLEKPGIRLGCVREGGAADVLLQKIMEVHCLDKGNVLKNVRRMSPDKQLLAIRMGQLNAAMLPEQWATMADASGFKMLVTAQDVWPSMQGSVLAVKEDLITHQPGLVKKMIGTIERANALIQLSPREAAEIVTRQMLMTNGGIVQSMDAGVRTAITPDIMLRSMNRLEYAVGIDPVEVQKTIDYMAGLGYIKKSFEAGDILDLKFLENDRAR